LKISSFNIGAGALLIFTATLFWAVENTLSKHLLKDINPRVLAFGRLFFGSIFIAVYMFVVGKLSIISALGMKQLSWILVSAVFLLLYVVTWYSGLKHVRVTTATAILLLGSPITTVLSAAFIGVALSLSQAIGILMLVAGVAPFTLIEWKHHLPSSSTA
jgi:drug/metabolite transporter (DMT)-like permease